MRQRIASHVSYGCQTGHAFHLAVDAAFRDSGLPQPPSTYLFSRGDLYTLVVEAHASSPARLLVLLYSPNMRVVTVSEDVVVLRALVASDLIRELRLGVGTVLGRRVRHCYRHASTVAHAGVQNSIVYELHNCKHAVV